jgi:hypothetical protein
VELLIILVGFVVFVVPLWALARTFSLKRESVSIEDLAAFEKRIGWH